MDQIRKSNYNLRPRRRTPSHQIIFLHNIEPINFAVSTQFDYYLCSRLISPSSANFNSSTCSLPTLVYGLGLSPSPRTLPTTFYISSKDLIRTLLASSFARLRTSIEFSPSPYYLLSLSKDFVRTLYPLPLLCISFRT